jgi:hypothetical protein
LTMTKSQPIVAASEELAYSQAQTTAMFLLLSRLFLLLLLAVDWADDPYFGHSPLSRPLSSQDAFCHSLAHRVAVLQAVHRGWSTTPLLQPSELTTASQVKPPIRAGEKEQRFLSANDPLYAYMSLQC